MAVDTCGINAYNLPGTHPLSTTPLALLASLAVLGPLTYPLHLAAAYGQDAVMADDDMGTKSVVSPAATERHHSLQAANTVGEVIAMVPPSSDKSSAPCLSRPPLCSRN